jgi:hypothetical protein
MRDAERRLAFQRLIYSLISETSSCCQSDYERNTNKWDKII